MKTILVPTDFSDNADAALSFAMLLAKQHRSTLVVINVFSMPVPVAPLPFEALQESQNELAMTVLAQLRAFCSRITYGGDIAFEYHALEGSPIDRISAFADETDADLVVMGTQGENSVGDILFGTTTAEVMKKTSRPVLAIPQGMKFDRQPAKIAYATGFLASDLDALQLIVKIARPFNAQICLLHINAGQTEFGTDTNKIYEFTKVAEDETGYSNYALELIQSDDIEASLLEYAQSGKTDLLVMSSRQRNAFTSIIDPSKAAHLIENSPVPVIAFHHSKKEKPLAL